MILLKILDHDLHAAKKGSSALPLFLETPAKEGFLPSVVSSSRGKFLVSRRLTSEGRLRSGIFDHDSDRLDEIIGPAVAAAYDLSVSEGWENVFRGPDRAALAFAYIQERSGFLSQPHACLVPKDPSGCPFDPSTDVYEKICKVYSYAGDVCVFLSRPDFVGMYTQFVGGKSSLILHNVRNGMAFCASPPPHVPGPIP